MRKITALVLERLGYRVQEASSGEEALRLAQESREKIDLLMTEPRTPLVPPSNAMVGTEI